MGARVMRALSRRVSTPLWSVVVLFVISCVIGVVAYVAAVHNYQASQASQRRQGVLLEQRLCTTLGSLAALKPPSGAGAANPSRAYDQQLHAALAQLGPDVGCQPVKIYPSPKGSR